MATRRSTDVQGIIKKAVRKPHANGLDGGATTSARRTAAGRKRGPRAVGAGDVAPVLTPEAIEIDRVAQVTEARQGALASALDDIVESGGRTAKATEQAIEAILSGASPDDARLLRHALRHGGYERGKRIRINPDEVLADDWRDGGYPYRNLMLRKNYEREKYRLQAEQLRRFREREAHPLKQWKLSPIDKASLDKWEGYTKAKEAMFFATDTADSPWTVIKSDCKKRARVNAMRYVLHKLNYGNKDAAHLGTVDPLLVGRAHVVYERGEQRMGPLL